MLRETTRPGLCGLVCPSRTSERGGEGDCVKEGGEEMGSARGSVHWGCGVGRGAREGACTGAATTPQPSNLRLILSFLNARERFFGRKFIFPFWPLGGINVLCDGFQPDPGRRQIRRCVRDERRLAAGSRRIAWCARRRVQIKGAGRHALKNLRSWRAGGARRAYPNPPYIPGRQLPRKAGCGSLAAAGRSALKALG